MAGPAGSLGQDFVGLGLDFSPGRKVARAGRDCPGWPGRGRYSCQALVQPDAPVHAHHVATQRGYLVEHRACAGAEINHRDAAFFSIFD